MNTMHAVTQNTKHIDGRHIAKQSESKTAAAITQIKNTYNITPCLGVILVEGDPASAIYVASKQKKAESLGLKHLTKTFPATATQDDVAAQIAEWNNDSNIHGILLQLPLPAHMDAYDLLQSVAPDKDVDGLHTVNTGRLSWQKTDCLIPCTPMGCLMLLEETIDSFTGLHAVMVGSSNLVGRPMAQLLLQKNCTVSIAHSKTKALPDLTRQADILIVATGNPHLIRGDMIKPGAVVIDVGINRLPDSKRIVGDVNFDEAQGIAGAITPVPGGVGPMTIACLMDNTVKAACLQNDISPI